MAILKQNETPDTKMNAKEKMLHITKLWQEAKDAKKDDIVASSTVDEVIKKVDSEAGEEKVDIEKPKGKTPRAGMGVKKGK